MNTGEKEPERHMVQCETNVNSPPLRYPFTPGTKARRRRVYEGVRRRVSEVSLHSTSGLPLPVTILDPPSGWERAADEGLSDDFVKKLCDSVSLTPAEVGDVAAALEECDRRLLPGLGLRAAQSLALYTAETRIYDELGKALRSRQDESIEPFLPLLWGLDEALRFLGPGWKVLYRGIGRGVRLDRLFTVGEYLRWESVSSATDQLNVAESFANPQGCGSWGTVCVIATARGAPIWTLSEFGGEREVLLPANMLLRVASVATPAHLQLLEAKYGVVVLEEVDEEGGRGVVGVGRRREVIGALMGEGGVYATALSCFVPPPSLEEGRSNRRRVSEAVEEFLHDEGARAMVVQGEAGSGKTMLALWIVQTLLAAGGTWFPVYVELGRVPGVGEERGAVLKHMKETLQLTDPEWEELVGGGWRPVFVLDGYDEAHTLVERGLNVAVYEELGNIIGAKVLTLCRAGTVGGGAVKQVFGLPRSDGQFHVKAVSVEEFGEEEVEEVVRRLESPSQGCDTLQHSYDAPLSVYTSLSAGEVLNVLKRRRGLLYLARSPVVLRMVLECVDGLAEGDEMISRYEVYRRGLKYKMQKAVRDGMVPGGIDVDALLARCGRLAMKLHSLGGRGTLDEVGEGQDDVLRVGVEALPIRVEEHQGVISFRHRTMEEFFVAREVGLDVMALRHVDVSDIGIRRNHGVVRFLWDVLHDKEERVTGCGEEAMQVYCRLAVVRRGQTRYKEAGALLERALAIRERDTGSQTLAAAPLLINLALVRFREGRYAEAERVSSQVVQIHKHAFGENDPRTANTMSIMAAACHAQEKDDEAKELGLQAQDIIRRELGEDHAFSAFPLRTLSQVARARGEFEAAGTCAERCLDIRERAMGREHVDTAKAMCTLGSVRLAQGLVSEAEMLFECARGSLGRILGREHPIVSGALLGLGRVRVKQGSAAEAGVLCEKALEMRLRNYGDSHPHTAATLHGLGEAREAEGKLTEALGLFERAIEVPRPGTRRSGLSREAFERVKRTLDED